MTYRKLYAMVNRVNAAFTRRCVRMRGDPFLYPRLGFLRVTQFPAGIAARGPSEPLNGFVEFGDSHFLLCQGTATAAPPIALGHM
jgi:hypothetical protein